MEEKTIKDKLLEILEAVLYFPIVVGGGIMMFMDLAEMLGMEDPKIGGLVGIVAVGFLFVRRFHDEDKYKAMVIRQQEHIDYLEKELERYRA